jgi:hypothetical protein
MLLVTNPRILQVSMADKVHVVSGKTKNPNVLTDFADAIKENIRASSIANTFLAEEISAIQEARKQQGIAN